MKKQWVIVEQHVYPSDYDNGPEVFWNCAWGPYDDEETANLVQQALFNATDQYYEFTVVELKARPE